MHVLMGVCSLEDGLSWRGGVIRGFCVWLFCGLQCVSVDPFSVRLPLSLLCSPCGALGITVTSIAVVPFPRAVGLRGTRWRRGVKMLRLVKWQRLQNARLGHVTLLYGSCMPRFGDSPAVKFVRLDLTRTSCSERARDLRPSFVAQDFKHCRIVHAMSH